MTRPQSHTTDSLREHEAAGPRVAPPQATLNVNGAEDGVVRQRARPGPECTTTLEPRCRRGGPVRPDTVRSHRVGVWFASARRLGADRRRVTVAPRPGPLLAG